MDGWVGGLVDDWLDGWLGELVDGFLQRSFMIKKQGRIRVE